MLQASNGVQLMKTTPLATVLADGTRLASLAEIAVMLGVSIDTVRRMGARGEIEIIKVSPRTSRVRMSKLMPMHAS